MKKKKESKQPDNLAKLKEIRVWGIRVERIRMEGGKQKESSREFCALGTFQGRKLGQSQESPHLFPTSQGSLSFVA